MENKILFRSKVNVICIIIAVTNKGVNFKCVLIYIYMYNYIAQKMVEL